MIQNVLPGPRSGSVRIPASKSQAHRLLICAALGREQTTVYCDGLSKDILATVRCLNSLGAEIQIEDGALAVTPIRQVPLELVHLYCGESGSTLRFLLPVVGALRARAVFHREGRLPDRPLHPLDEQLRAGGMLLREEGSLLYCEGSLSCGSYTLPGNVSSQYISGMLMALPRVSGDSRLTVTGPVESAAYIRMTLDALGQFGIQIDRQEKGYRIPGEQSFAGPAAVRVEGDWSNAAFFLCLGALSDQGVCVQGLSEASSQGDQAVLDILRRFGAEVRKTEDGILVRKGSLRGIRIDAAPVPDLIPVLSIVAAAAQGETRVENALRLRLKESDRIKSSVGLICCLGGQAEELDEGLVIRGSGSLLGGTVDACGDHRIAMSAAVAASICEQAIVFPGAECVEKSYPRFWSDLEQTERS